MAEKITISAPFSQESRSLGRIGRVGENLSRQIVFDCSSALTDRPNANIICVIQRTGDKEPYAAQMTRVGDTGSYKLVLTSTEVAKSGSVRFELRMVDGDEILKAAIYTGTVEASMSGIGDTPGEPIPDALNRLESAISEVGKYADLKEKVDALENVKSTAEANKTAISGSDTYDTTKGTVQSRLTALEASSGAVEVDTTLSVSGKAADAKATGDKVKEVAQSVTTLNTSVTSLGTTVTGLNTSVTNMDTRVTALESAGGGGTKIVSVQTAIAPIDWGDAGVAGGQHWYCNVDIGTKCASAMICVGQRVPAEEFRALSSVPNVAVCSPVRGTSTQIAVLYIGATKPSTVVYVTIWAIPA